MKKFKVKLWAKGISYETMIFASNYTEAEKLAKLQYGNDINIRSTQEVK
jgi:hypothetical protein